MTREQNVLLMGILSIVCCCVLGPFTWIRANNILGEMYNDASIDSSEQNLVNAGKICAMVGTVFLAITVLGVLFDLAIGGVRR